MDSSERERGRERNIDLLFYSFVYSLVDYCVGPARGSNPWPWCIGRRSNPLSYLSGLEV